MLAAIFLASDMCSAVWRPGCESLLSRLGAWNLLVIEPSSVRNLSILQQCSWVMPTRLAIWLFCKGFCSRSAIRIFCSEIRKELNDAVLSSFETGAAVAKPGQCRKRQRQAKDSRSFPVGVRRFKSCPLHHVSSRFLRPDNLDSANCARGLLSD